MRNTPLSRREFDCLRDTDLFVDLSAQEFAALDEQLLQRAFKPGETVLDPVRERDLLFVLRTGRVRVFRTSGQGRELTVAILGQGSVFGEMPLLGQRMGNNVVEALDDTEVCVINSRHVRELLIADPRIAFRLLSIVSERIGWLEARLAEVTFSPVPLRLAQTILTVGERRRCGGLLVRMTHAQIANLIGASRESVSRALSQLTGLGLVMPGRARLVVPSATNLAAYARSLEG